ncbi:hypothetical protein M0R01_02365 [bacterium]|nr:hypothetical protein [bacterium]
MNEKFRVLNRETELLIEEKKRAEINLDYIDYQIWIYEEKVDSLVVHWKTMSPDFINRHFLFLNRRIDDLQEERTKLVYILGEMNRCLRTNEEKIWNIVEAKTIPVLI